MRKTFQNKCYFLSVKGFVQTFRASRSVALGEILLAEERKCVLHKEPHAVLQLGSISSLGMTMLCCACTNTSNGHIVSAMHQIGIYG